MPNETRLVTIDPRQIAELDAIFGGGSRKFNVAMQAAISRTMVTGVARSARRISDTVNLRIADLKKQVSVKKPSFSNLQGTLSMKRAPVPLIKYLSAAQVQRVQQVRLKKGKNRHSVLTASAHIAEAGFRTTRGTGITVRVRKGGAVEKFPESFVQRMGSGHQGIYRRVVKQGLSARDNAKRRLGGIPSIRVGRFPIKERMGPTAVGVLANAPGNGAKTILDEVSNELAGVLQKNIGSQIDRLLNAPNSFGKFTAYAGSEST